MPDRSTTLRSLLILGILLSVGALFIRYVALHDYAVFVEGDQTLAAAQAAPLIAADTLACEWADAPYLVASENVFSPLIYYSHVFPMIGSAVLAFIIWRQRGRELVNKLFVLLSVAFIAWCFFDLILWADANPDLIMFFWSAQIYADPFIYFSAAYLFYVFVRGTDLPFNWKLCGAGAFVPVLLLAPTALTLVGFDYTNCDREAVEGLLWHYVYFVEILTVLAMVIFGLRELFGNHERNKKIQIALLGMGLTLFLLAFSWGNLVGSFTEDWAVAQYGLFGMPIFLAVVTYLIVQYQAFEVRVIATTALVTSLWILLFSVLLLETIESAKPIIIVTLVFFAIMGVLLVRSVRREIEQRELIEKQEREMKIVNRQQENLLAFISHEVKGYLTKSRAAFAGIAQGDYGAVPAPLASMAASGLNDMSRGVDMVADILDASNLRKGTVSYERQPFDLKRCIEEVVHDLAAPAREKGIELSFAAAEGDYRLIGDGPKMRRHVIRNLVDNAIRYTQKGTIAVSLSRSTDMIHFSVKDTGVGITKEDMQNLFTEGGHGRESSRVNAESTGYGLFIAKQVVEAHKGTIRAESQGRGAGSIFVVELPAA